MLVCLSTYDSLNAEEFQMLYLCELLFKAIRWQRGLGKFVELLYR
jgi:hypothetical protein